MTLYDLDCSCKSSSCVANVIETGRNVRYENSLGHVDVATVLHNV